MGALADIGQLTSRSGHHGAGRTFVSLYSGAGGLDAGFIAAGFTPLWSSEKDRQAAITRRNALTMLGRHLAYQSTGGLGVLRHEDDHGDIDLLQRRQWPDPASNVTAVIGGPPCQGFSQKGKMDPHDPRSRHVHRFLEMVAHLEPQVFVMENVKALLVSRRWVDVREALLARAAEVGYETTWVVLNAADFGVAQNRERAFLIGSRVGVPGAPEPTTPGAARPTVRDALESLPPFGEPGNAQTCPARITILKNPVLRASPYAGMVFNGPGRVMRLDAPAPTMLAAMGGNSTPIVDQDEFDHGTPAWIDSYHAHLQAGGSVAAAAPGRLRRITVEEAAAIQGFPQWWPWHGPRTGRYRQIGNAVPPPLAWAVAESVKDTVLRSQIAA